MRRSDKGLVVYRVSGLASDLGLRVGQVVVEPRGRERARRSQLSRPFLARVG